MVLNAFTTFAPDHSATCSAADVVKPTTSPFKSGRRGLVQSTTTLERRSPQSRIACSAAGHGTDSTTTSLAPAASRLLPAFARPPVLASNALSSLNPHRELQSEPHDPLQPTVSPVLRPRCPRPVRQSSCSLLFCLPAILKQDQPPPN